jgi:molybdopterin/thiamine biosynthesis adenylyltransferase
MRPDIVVPGALWDEVHRHLIRSLPDNPHPVEEHAFLLTSLSESRLGLRLLAREVMLATSDDLETQTASELKPKPEYVERMMNRCQAEGLSLVDVHAHSFDHSNTTSFSSTDLANNSRTMPAMRQHMGSSFRHAALVVGQKSLAAHLYDPNTSRLVPIEQITVVGSQNTSQARPPLMHIATTNSAHKALELPLDGRYQRQVLFFGEEVQRLLSRLTVGVVGDSGLGSHVVMQLAHLGVGHLLLIDPQRIEETNLNRLLGVGTWAVGQPKVTVYQKLIERISPATRVTALPVELLSETGMNYAKGADILMGCVDNHGARLILNQLANRYLIPLIDGGTGINLPGGSHKALTVGGQVQVVLPGATSCLECRGAINMHRAHFDLLPEADQAIERSLGYGTDETAPSVISLNGVVASLQVTELLSLVSGNSLQQGIPGIIMYNSLERTVTTGCFPKREDCPTCSKAGVLAIGDTAPLERATRSHNAIPTVAQPEENTSEEP